MVNCKVIGPIRSTNPIEFYFDLSAVMRLFITILVRMIFTNNEENKI